MTRRRGLGTVGMAWLWVSGLVLVPVAALSARAATATLPRALEVIGAPRTLAALRLSFGAALAAATLNLFLGLLVAWVLARYRFPARGLLDALVELPFALPTSVAGITLTHLYADGGWIGARLAPLGIQLAYTRPAVVLALTFVGLPFVVRAVQPVVQGLDPTLEEASASLGATRWQTFVRVTLPLLLPAALTGFALAFARGVGEYGSVVFLSGNLPYRTEIAPLLVVSRLEQYDDQGAALVALVMLAASLALLAVVQLLERWTTRRLGDAPAEAA